MPTPNPLKLVVRRRIIRRLLDVMIDEILLP